MTSIEFVIWMRGFMAGARKDEAIGTARVELLREQLAKVDGVPTPREKRTILLPPEPLALPAEAERA